MVFRKSLRLSGKVEGIYCFSKREVCCDVRAERRKLSFSWSCQRIFESPDQYKRISKLSEKH